MLEPPQLEALIELGSWSNDLQQELSWYEKAETEGNSALRYLLGHHFPGFLQPFVARAYFYFAAANRAPLARVYFHAVVDALLPSDGKGVVDPKLAAEDEAPLYHL